MRSSRTVTPAAADHSGDSFTFEKSVSTLEDGNGFADVWKRGFFGWEYKGKHKSLSAAYAQPLLRDVATIILEMGLRPEEVFHMRAVNVHLSATTPYVHVPDGKTVNARRDAAVTKEVMPVLHRRLATAKGEYLFPLRVGGGHDWEQPMKQLQPAHREALKNSGIKPPFRIYDLRHTYGTRAAEAGTNPLSLARLMGHADLKTTQRYVHLSKRHLEEAQVRIEQVRAESEIAEAEQEQLKRGSARPAIAQ